MSTPDPTARIVEYGFWPDENGPLGLLLTVNEHGLRVTRPCDGEYLRLAVSAGHDARKGIDLPEHTWLPIQHRGWPDEWPERPALLDSIVDDLTEGVTFAEVREDVIEAARLTFGGAA